MWYKFKCAVARFMYGRNGMDQLNRALFWLYIVLWLVGSLVSAVLKSNVLTAVFNGVMWILFVILFSVCSLKICISGGQKTRNGSTGCGASKAIKPAQRPAMRIRNTSILPARIVRPSAVCLRAREKSLSPVPSAAQRSRQKPDNIKRFPGEFSGEYFFENENEISLRRRG